MVYYLMEVTTYVDETPKAKGIYEYEDEISALAKFHQKLGGAMANENFATELVQVVAGNGVVIATEYFERPIEPIIEDPFVEDEGTKSGKFVTEIQE
jgi:hypothetical protein